MVPTKSLQIALLLKIVKDFSFRIATEQVRENEFIATNVDQKSTSCGFCTFLLGTVPRFHKGVKLPGYHFAKLCSLFFWSVGGRQGNRNANYTPRVECDGSCFLQ